MVLNSDHNQSISPYFGVPWNGQFGEWVSYRRWGSSDSHMIRTPGHSKWVIRK